ncbi:MAG: hypothetical protein IBJ18_00720 [Phycisphaerales bacterium]|nr:hypothetical protein [Phycisphaerales bacterium]
MNGLESFTNGPESTGETFAHWRNRLIEHLRSAPPIDPGPEGNAQRALVESLRAILIAQIDARLDRLESRTEAIDAVGESLNPPVSDAS